MADIPLGLDDTRCQAGSCYLENNSFRPNATCDAHQVGLSQDAVHGKIELQQPWSVRRPCHNRTSGAECRENDVLIEDLDTVPTVEEVVQEFEDSKLDETLNELRGMQQEVLESTSLADPIESRKDAEVDENSPDDTPASDMI